MTSSNVSNLLVQVGTIDKMPKSDKPEVKNTDNLFVKTLQNVNGLTPAKDSAPAPANSENTGEIKTSKLDTTSPKREIKQEDTKEPDASEVAEKVEVIVEEVEKVIEKKLDVTDEDIELAMETLGLTAIDLLDPQNLAQLVTELTGEEDSISLVMSEEFAGILDEVTELTNQLIQDVGNSLPEIKELLIEMEPVNQTGNFDFQLPEPKQSAELPVENAEVAVEQPEIVEEPVISQAIEPQLKTSVKEEAGQEVKETVDVTPEKTEAVITEEKPVEEAPKQDNNSDQNNFTPEKKEEQVAPKTTVKESHQPTIRQDEGNPMIQPRTEIQFSVEEQVVELPTGESVKASDIVNQFIEQARVLTTNESTTMELTINPEGLGKIFLEVTQKGNEITAKIFTENDAVKQALESQMANLRTEFNQNSTKVTSIEVSVGTHEFERNLDENARQDSQREEQAREQSSRRRGRIDLNSLDELSGLMSDEEMLIAQMMRDNGGTLDFMA
ncbi:MAG: flagellar hook-length control protein FliK [Pseudobutyrivibrio sp.]|nr:flagellar hook-length control protein FliK [Pseudobutyrivibrio sp.]